jgi:hypothetical protein
MNNWQKSDYSQELINRSKQSQPLNSQRKNKSKSKNGNIWVDTCFMEHEQKKFALRKEDTMNVYFFHINTLSFIQVHNEMTIGRSPEAEFSVIDDDSLSGLHAKVQFKEEDGKVYLYLQDLDSKNGTIVDGQLLGDKFERKIFRSSYFKIGKQIFIVTKEENIDINMINNVIQRVELSLKQIA